VVNAEWCSYRHNTWYSYLYSRLSVLVLVLVLGSNVLVLDSSELVLALVFILLLGSNVLDSSVLVLAVVLVLGSDVLVLDSSVLVLALVLVLSQGPITSIVFCFYVFLQSS